MSQIWFVRHTVQFRGKPMRCVHSTGAMDEALAYARIRNRKGSTEIEIAGYELKPIETFEFVEEEPSL